MLLPRWLFLSLVLLLAGLPGATAADLQAGQNGAFQLIALEGGAQVRESGDAPFRPARAAELLGPGAALQTGPGGRAMLFLPRGVFLKLGEESLVEFGPPAPQTASNPAEVPVTLRTGTLGFAVDLSDPRPGVLLYTPASRVVVPQGIGFLVRAAQDRLVCLEGRDIAVSNLASGRHLAVAPRRAAISEKDGRLTLSRVQPGEMDRLQAGTRVTLAMPPMQSLMPPSPAVTPITVADQVRQPWPVLPPVIQSQNLWIHEASGANGRIFVRPVPRR